MTMLFVCAVAVGTFVMAPAELGEPASVRVALHGGAHLAQREGGGGDRLRLEQQQPQHERQERTIQRECGGHVRWWFPQKTQSIEHKRLKFYKGYLKVISSHWKKKTSYIHKTSSLQFLQICFPREIILTSHRSCLCNLPFFSLLCLQEMRLELDEKQEVMRSLQETAHRLCQENHPAKQTVEVNPS